MTLAPARLVGMIGPKNLKWFMWPRPRPCGTVLLTLCRDLLLSTYTPNLNLLTPPITKTEKAEYWLVKGHWQ